MTDLKEDLEAQKNDMILNYELKLQRLEAELDLRMKVEIHEIEERKNEHINELMHNHEEAFTELKQYFNDITRENLELIKQHKEKLSELRNSTVTAENMLKSLVKAADELKGPLEAAKQKAGDLEASVKDFDMDVMSLRNAKGYLKDLKARIKHLKDDRDALDEKFKKVTHERNDMHAKFETAVM